MLLLSVEEIRVFQACACEALLNLFVGVARPAHFVRGSSRGRAVGAVCAHGALLSLPVSGE